MAPVFSFIKGMQNPIPPVAVTWKDPPVEEVLRAIVLRCHASPDVDIVRGIRGSVLDPSMVSPTTHDVMIIDANWKLDRRIPTKASLPVEVLNRFRIEDYG